MIYQHSVWALEVKNKMKEKGWNNTDLAQIVGVSRATISEMFKYGKGSDELKLRVSRNLGVLTTWKEV